MNESTSTHPSSPAPAADPANGHPRHWIRFVVSVSLLVLAVLLTPLTVIASWGKAQIVDTNRYVQTVRPLARDPAVQEYVATTISTALLSQLDVANTLNTVLPDTLRPLVPTVAIGVQGFVTAAARQFTQSTAFVDLWVAANRLGHSVVRGVLTGRTNVAKLQNGQLSLDIGDIVRTFQAYLVDHGLALAGRIDLSKVDKQIVIASGDQLRQIEVARKAVGALEALTWLLFLATVTTATASVLVAANRRRALTRLGVGIALSMVLVAAGLSVARRAFLSSISASLPAPVASSLFDTISASMQAGLRTVFGLGIVIAALVLITNLDGYATRWSRPTEVGVVVLAVVALLGRNNVDSSYALSLVVATAITVGVLELVRRRQLSRQRGQAATTVSPAAAA